jgi:hypothetical protein
MRLRVEVALGGGDVAGGVDEGAELGVGHFGAADLEGADRHRADLNLFPIEAVIAHAERPAVDPHEISRRSGRGEQQRDGGGSQGHMVAQSSAMSTTVQPSSRAAASALSNSPTWLGWS